MIKDKISLDFTCQECGDKNHKWYEVYYGDCVTLKKIDKTYIAWCEKTNDYVLIQIK